MQQCAAWKWNFHNVILLIHKISWTFEYEIQLHCHWGKNSSAYFCKLNVIFECLTRKNTEKEHMLEDSDLEKIFIFEQCWVSRHFVCKSLCYFTNVKNFRTKKNMNKKFSPSTHHTLLEECYTHRWRWLTKAQTNSFRTKRRLIPSSPNY